MKTLKNLIVEELESKEKISEYLNHYIMLIYKVFVKMSQISNMKFVTFFIIYFQNTIDFLL